MVLTQLSILGLWKDVFQELLLVLQYYMALF